MSSICKISNYLNYYGITGMSKLHSRIFYFRIFYLLCAVNVLFNKLRRVWLGILGHPEIWPWPWMALLIKPIDHLEVKITQKVYPGRQGVHKYLNFYLFFLLCGYLVHRTFNLFKSPVHILNSDYPTANYMLCCPFLNVTDGHHYSLFVVGNCHSV